MSWLIRDGKKVAIDYNQVFANITKIKEAQDEASRLKETSEQRG
jgi:hypothetical protein